MASDSTRGRAFGRGRGFGAPRKPGVNTPSPNPQNGPKSSVGTESDLTTIVNNLKEETLSSAVESLSQYISVTNSSVPRMKEVVDCLCQLSLKDSEFAALTASVAAKLCNVGSFGSTFRGVLLKTTQEHYKNRENVRSKSTRGWTGLVSLVCQLFSVLRTGDAPLKPLAGAVHQMLSELLREGKPKFDEDDEVDCFYHQFKSIGKLLQSVDAGKVDDLLAKVRDTIVANTSTAKTRCLLLELIELHACGWNMSADIERYYGDMLADIMANLE